MDTIYDILNNPIKRLIYIESFQVGSFRSSEITDMIEYIINTRINTFKELDYKLYPEDDKISETEYYLKEVKYPMNPAGPNKEYTVSLNLDDDDQLLVQNMNEDNDAEETAELLKDLFPDFSYVKRKRKPKKE